MPSDAVPTALDITPEVLEKLRIDISKTKLLILNGVHVQSFEHQLKEGDLLVILMEYIHYIRN